MDSAPLKCCLCPFSWGDHTFPFDITIPTPLNLFEYSNSVVTENKTLLVQLVHYPFWTGLTLHLTWRDKKSIQSFPASFFVSRANSCVRCCVWMEECACGAKGRQRCLSLTVLAGVTEDQEMWVSARRLLWAEACSRVIQMSDAVRWYSCTQGAAGTSMMSCTVLCRQARGEKLRDCSCSRTRHGAVHP